MADLGLNEILSYTAVGLTVLRLAVVLVAIPVVWGGALVMLYMMVRSMLSHAPRTASHVE
ncbi:MAG: hypothetical protein JSV65_15205 [Armatimonadota bacterium]|nr:MAG: hypothetical protein JSV65_15205 [Armatimonadota bacterium]